MPTDLAVRVALLATELITNAAKHAGAGRIFVKLSAPDATPLVTLSVRDEGQGMPEDFSFGRVQSLGMKIIRALVGQMGADLTVTSARPGAEFVVKIPVNLG